jgi:hypothetical protein
MNRFMMMFLRSAVGILVAPMLLAHAATYSIPYQVSLQRLAPGSGSLGFATIFTEYNTNSTLVGYAGIVEGVEPNLRATTCNATNGCGVHIHNGTSCANTTTQGGHYWVKTGTVTSDPWVNARYSSDNTSKANFQGVLDIGTTDVNGRVFIGTLPELFTAHSKSHDVRALTVYASSLPVHSQNGTRIGCGKIEVVPNYTTSEKVLSSGTSNLTSSGVSSQVTVYTIQDDEVCYFGSAKKLEPNLLSYLSTNPTGGTNCNFTNGCGVHIHNGTSCFNRTTQGGHYYNTPVDPWLYTMYLSTNAQGDAYYTGCVQTGVTGGAPAFTGRAFVVHSDNGTRVSCGILSANKVAQPPAPSPIAAPAPTPTKCTDCGFFQRLLNHQQKSQKIGAPNPTNCEHVARPWILRYKKEGPETAKSANQLRSIRNRADIELMTYPIDEIDLHGR